MGEGERVRNVLSRTPASFQAPGLLTLRGAAVSLRIPFAIVLGGFLPEATLIVASSSAAEKRHVRGGACGGLGGVEAARKGTGGRKRGVDAFQGGLA